MPLEAQLAHFRDVVAGQVAPVVSALEGRRSLEVTLEIERAVAPERVAA